MTRNKIKPVPFSIRLNSRDVYLLRKICEWETRSVADEVRLLIKNEATRLGVEKASNEVGLEYDTNL